MKKFSVSYIRRWLVLFVVMVILTTMTTYLLAYVEIVRTLSDYKTSSNVQASAVIQNSHPSQLSGLKSRLLLLLSAAVIMICGLGYILIGLATRQLNRPLRIISNAISRMARGKLNATVTIDAQEEYTQIANGINELAANLQELLLYIWKQSGQCLEQIEKLEAEHSSDGNDPISAARLEHIHQIYKSVNSLRNMAKAYVFYDVHLEGENTLSISESRHATLTDNDRSMNNKN